MTSDFSFSKKGKELIAIESSEKYKRANVAINKETNFGIKVFAGLEKK